MHLENWADSRSEAEFQSVPLERRWVESGRELSTVAATLYAGRSLVLSSWTMVQVLWHLQVTTHLPLTDRLNVRELTSGAIFKVTW